MNRSVEFIHFDNNAADMTRQHDLLKKHLRDEPLVTSIPADADHWPGFTQAVVSSRAGIVIPTTHGMPDGRIGPSPDLSQHVASVFEPGSINAGTLVVFACHQAQNLADWRRIAPRSRIVLHPDVTAGIVPVVKYLLGLPYGSLKGKHGNWQIHEPVTSPRRP